MHAPCVLHVYGNYWQTGWESRIIELRQSLIFLNQLQPLALISLVLVAYSLYPSINSSYSIYVRITLNSLTAFTLCTLSLPPALEYLVPLLKVANLTLDTFYHYFR